MIKSKELTDPQSCLNKAADDEMTFVLLGRDPAAPVAIKAWIRERIRIGKNKPVDPQIQEATECLVKMIAQSAYAQLKNQPTENQ